MNEINLARLRWACRRGMLELDILLGRFLEENYPSLSPDAQKQFVELLACGDQDLFMWLTGKENPSDPNLLSIVETIRHAARNNP